MTIAFEQGLRAHDRQSDQMTVSVEAQGVSFGRLVEVHGRAGIADVKIVKFDAPGGGISRVVVG